MLDTGNGNNDTLNSILSISKKTQEAEIIELFPQLVYKKLLDPTPEIFNAMLNFVEKYDEETQNITTTRESQQTGIPDLSDDMSGGMSGGMSAGDEDPKRPKSSTGDVTGTGVISNLPVFEWLTREVEKCVIEYLQKNQIDARHISVFHQKSWPVVTRKDSAIAWHSHPNASVSVVYYLNDLNKDDGGSLLFQNPNRALLAGRIVGENIYKSKRAFTDGIRPSRNTLIIFPSHLIHSVSPLKSDQNRYSITYDIMLTAGRMIDPGASENIVPHPEFWKPFKQQPSEDQA